MAKAKLVLTGRARMPERAEWETWRQTRGDADPVSQRILRIQALEALGAEVLTVSADVGDVGQMQEAFRQAEARFGAVHGVIHGAGIVGATPSGPSRRSGGESARSSSIRRSRASSPSTARWTAATLDFCMLTSSLSSVLGGYAYAAYAAANIFMDAYAHARNRQAGAALAQRQLGRMAARRAPAESGARVGPRPVRR